MLSVYGNHFKERQPRQILRKRLPHNLPPQLPCQLSQTASTKVDGPFIRMVCFSRYFLSLLTVTMAVILPRIAFLASCFCIHVCQNFPWSLFLPILGRGGAYCWQLLHSFSRKQLHFDGPYAFLPWQIQISTPNCAIYRRRFVFSDEMNYGSVIRFFNSSTNIAIKQKRLRK